MAPCHSFLKTTTLRLARLRLPLETRATIRQLRPAAPLPRALVLVLRTLVLPLPAFRRNRAPVLRPTWCAWVVQLSGCWASLLSSWPCRQDAWSGSQSWYNVSRSQEKNFHDSQHTITFNLINSVESQRFKSMTFIGHF